MLIALSSLETLKAVDTTAFNVSSDDKTISAKDLVSVKNILTAQQYFHIDVHNYNFLNEY